MKETGSLYIEGTAKAPQIDLNHFSGELILSGRSIPENAAKVFEPVLDWISNYIKSPNITTNFRLNLEYFNTSTSIYLAKIIKRLSSISNPECKLFIHIYFTAEESASMDKEEIKDIMGSLTDTIGETTISIGVKVYATDDNGKIVKETQVFI